MNSLLCGKSIFSATVFVAFLLGQNIAQGDDRAPIGDAVKDLPIFDAHIHYK